ncbi:MAG TPA: hypothetical protein EYP06_08705 [Desulfobacterales bacterium]|nr:hypothetical protein [Desulfobacterales bacterium]
MDDFFGQLWRAAKLDKDFYREVALDQEAMAQAYLAVVCYSVAFTLGAFGRTGIVGLNIGILTTLFSWYVWAFFTYFLGARIFKPPQGEVDRKGVFRAVGFACAPGLITALGLIPGLASISIPTAAVWMIVAWTYATKVVFGYESTGKAVLVCLIAWVLATMVQLSLFVLLFSVFGVSTG